MTTASRFLAALLFVIPAVATQAQDDGSRPREGYWGCSSMEQEGPVYITGLWSGNYIMADVVNSFTQELLAKHA